MIDTETIRVIQKLACGYDPNTGNEIGQNGIQIDQNISRALSRALAALRRKPKLVYELTDEEMELFNRLREYRNRKATELGLPAFRIAPDATLSEIAMVKPRSIGVLDKIYGLREKRIDDYGEDFIAVVSEHLKSKGAGLEG
jgi:superfamily II DNA helicase RecQ